MYHRPGTGGPPLALRLTEGLGVTLRAPAGQLDCNAFPGRSGAAMVATRAPDGKCRVEVLNSYAFKPVLRLGAECYYQCLRKVCELGQEVSPAACV